MDGAGDVLARLSHGDLLLGIASNSQPYTLRELTDALSYRKVAQKYIHGGYFLLLLRKRIQQT